MRGKVGMALGPLGALACWTLPLGLDAAGARMAGVMVWVVIWWICETIPLAATALFGAGLAVLLGIAPAERVFAPFAHPLIFLFLGGFLLAQAMRVHGVDQRIALYLLSRSWLKGSPTRCLLVLWGTTGLLSFWLSNTATTAMMLPISLGIVDSLLSGKEGDRGSVLITVAYCASIGGVATPVGSPPNIIALGMLEELAGIHLSFVEWMAFGVPVAVISYGLLSVLVLRHLPLRAGSLDAALLGERLKALGPLGPGERNALLALGLAVLLWVGPGIGILLLGKDHDLALWLKRCLPEPVVAVLASSLLFALPAGERRTLTWAEAVRIDWAALLLFGGGLSLGALMFDTGLAAALGSRLLELTGGSFWLFVVAATYFSIFFTEATSNTAAANLLIPLVIATCRQSGMDPLLPTLAVAASCSLAFMLPVATPPNAIMYGSGQVRLGDMVRLGWKLNLSLGACLLAVLVLFTAFRGA